MALGHTFATADQKIIDSLTLLFFTDHHMSDRILTSAVHFEIYCLRFTSRFARDSEPSDRLSRAIGAAARRQAPKPHLRDVRKPKQRKTTG
jgi:hypothetical protein